MTFTDTMREELAKSLDRSNVAQREQAGRKFSYIEGWHAIAEANRIFGFDGWTRETVDLRQLGEPRQTGDKWRVEYLAKVRIRVGEVIREGCGFGQGIDKDVGQAHESALKEAETDAMKRALMTFGNPFGLALYDKSQSNVSDGSDDILGSMKDAIQACETQVVLKKWWEDNSPAIPDRHYDAVLMAFNARLAAVKLMDRVAA